MNFLGAHRDMMNEIESEQALVRMFRWLSFGMVLGTGVVGTVSVLLK